MPVRVRLRAPRLYECGESNIWQTYCVVSRWDSCRFKSCHSYSKFRGSGQMAKALASGARDFVGSSPTYRTKICGLVAKLEDAPHLGCGVARHESSILSEATKIADVVELEDTPPSKDGAKA